MALVKSLGMHLANSLISISMKDKYVWFKNPKVASSTLDQTLQPFEIRNMPIVETRPHCPTVEAVHIKPYQVPSELFDSMISGDEYFRFTFVRNPYSRLVSAYLDKVAGNAPEKKNVLNLMDEEVDREIAFPEFVDAVTSAPSRRLDRHWRPQMHTTCAEWVEHDFVGKIETFNDDFATVARRIGMDTEEWYRKHAPHTTNAKEVWRDYVSDPTIARKIRDYYEQDFVVFGYEQ